MSTATTRRGLGGTLRPGTPTGADSPGSSPAAVPGSQDQQAEAPRAGGVVTRMKGWWRHARRQPQATWTSGQGLLTRALQGLFLVAMLCGPLGLFVAMNSSTQTAPAAAPAGYDERAESRRSTAEYLGREWVVAWLSTARGQEANLRGYWAQHVDLPEKASVVRQAEVVSAVPAEVGVWAVTVRVDLEPVAGAPVARRFYRTPVAVQGEGDSATAGVLALPSQVPGPGLQVTSAPQYGTAVTAGSPLGSTVTAFVQAAMSGRAGEVARYTAPGSQVHVTIPPAQAGYEAVQVTSIAVADGSVARAGEVPPEGTRARVKAEVRLAEKGTGPSSAGRPATWFLTLTTRAGRWEVSAVDQSPVIPEVTEPTQGEK